jgi:NDP-sugar pyrophosphorylase family protein
MTAGVILAAGAGTRLGELGRRYTKPMVPIAGRPLLDWVIARLRRAGVGRLVVVGHVSDAALATFLSTNHPDIAHVVQSERRGIADAVRLAFPLLAAEPAYVACACDSVFEAGDIGQLIALGQGHPEAAVIGVMAMGPAATASRSAVRVDGNRVRDSVEKPAPGSVASDLVALPLYWLPRGMRTAIETVPPIGAERYLSTALSGFIARGGTVLALPVSSRLEITTAEDVARAAAGLRD